VSERRPKIPEFQASEEGFIRHAEKPAGFQRSDASALSGSPGIA
jgi:hypothetical protein